LVTYLKLAGALPSASDSRASSSNRTQSGSCAFRRSTVRIPSFKVVLTSEVSTSDGRSSARRIRLARHSERINCPFSSCSLVPRLTGNHKMARFHTDLDILVAEARNLCLDDIFIIRLSQVKGNRV